MYPTVWQSGSKDHSICTRAFNLPEHIDYIYLCRVRGSERNLRVLDNHRRIYSLIFVHFARQLTRSPFLCEVLAVHRQTDNRTQIRKRVRRTAKYRALPLDYRSSATLGTPIETRDISRKYRLSLSHSNAEENTQKRVSRVRQGITSIPREYLLVAKY